MVRIAIRWILAIGIPWQICLGTAQAITVKNIDKDAHTLIFTERGVRGEQLVAGGGEASFCNDGCFIRFPNGHMQVFKGDETVTIQNGNGRNSN